jgi:hypothetical protein
VRVPSPDRSASALSPVVPIVRRLAQVDAAASPVAAFAPAVARLPLPPAVEVVETPLGPGRSADVLAFAPLAPPPAPRLPLQRQAWARREDAPAAREPSWPSSTPAPAGFAEPPAAPVTPLPVQRQVEGDLASATPAAAETASPAAPTAGPPPAPAGEDLEALAGRLYERIRRRLRAELMLDRERSGLTGDRR